MSLAPIPHIEETTALQSSIQIRWFRLVVNNNRNNGATFCHVNNRNEVPFDKLTNTIGPQKWNGAKAAFMSKPIINHFITIPLLSDPTLVNIANDPILCTMKYNIVIFFVLHFAVIAGKNDIRFSSIIIQIQGQVSDEIAPNVPNITPVHIKPLQPPVISFIH